MNLPRSLDEAIVYMTSMAGIFVIAGDLGWKKTLAQVGVALAVGYFLPAVPAFQGRFECARVSIPVAILIWLMIYPMMLKVDFTGIMNAGKKPKGLAITLAVDWLVKPFAMYRIAAPAGMIGASAARSRPD